MFTASSCSIVSLTISATSGILEGGFEAMNQETDLKLAAAAIPADLKLLDGLILKAPDNEELLLLGAQGYASYALGFVEDSSAARASEMYLRARDYGLRILFKNKAFKMSFNGNLDSFQKALSMFGKSDIPAIFWTANAWGSYINLNRDNIEAIADLPKVEAMMGFVLKHDETYFYGGAHLFFGTIEASLPPLFGGDTASARRHFERAIQISGGKFLMAYYYYAKTYAVMRQDRDLFRALLKKVVNAPVHILVQQDLANAIAKSKSKALLEKENDYF
ncbi:MAG: TRAP transporter TatT component family protein [Candidatus Kryptoniota bacterium]